VRVLTTKILSENQKSAIEGFTMDEISMIEISYGNDFKIEENITNAVFTSANSVRSVFEKHQIATSFFDVVFCVGSKTKQLLESFGGKVALIANNALELAELLAERFTKKSESSKEISWFCGNLRNNDLPQIMAENGVLVTEYMVYQTQLTPVKVENNYDAILFFSPSGIESYLKKNKPNSNPVICIGSTTATKAIEAFENVYISDSATVESVLDKVNEILVK
jgi:uroporphyrinogen-III synthase